MLHHQVIAVYTQPDKAAGRGRLLVSPPVKEAALSRNLPVVQPAGLSKAEEVAQLAAFHPDVIIVAAFGQILPQSVLDIPPYGCINIHPSLLPRFRGASPVTAAILAGDDFTGVSIALLDKDLDTGPILARATISISPRDTTDSLTGKLSLVAARLLQEVLVCWLRGDIAPRPQNDADAIYSGKITKEDGEIDWRLPTVDIWRRVRAFQPWPGCYTRWEGKQLKIFETVPKPGGKTVKAGQVIALNDREAAFGVWAGDGILGILKVQLEGKRVMSAVEFLRGNGELVGAILPN